MSENRWKTFIWVALVLTLFALCNSCWLVWVFLFCIMLYVDVHSVLTICFRVLDRFSVRFVYAICHIFAVSHVLLMVYIA